ncbi:MAG: hypothetical protein WCR76_10420 [Sphaerochaetaceae bacterium]
MDTIGQQSKRRQTIKTSPFLVALILVVLTTLVKSEELSFSSIINYDDAQPSNIVAVVIGYQNTVRHKSGVTIPVFSREDGSGDGKERGVLFFILAPTNFAGYVFFADCLKDSFSDAQTVPSEKSFPKDELHSFRISDFPIQSLLQAHCYIGPNAQLATGHLARQRYLSSEQEAMTYLAQLRNQRVVMENERKLCEGIAAEEEKRFIAQGIHWYKNDNSETTLKYRENNGRKRTLTLRIRETDVAIEDAEKQVNRLNAYRENQHLSVR